MSRRYWYQYDGTGDDQTPGNYRTPLNILPSGCVGGTLSCAIYAPEGGPFPSEVSDNIKDYLTTAKNNGYASYPILSTPYVGTKPV